MAQNLNDILKCYDFYFVFFVHSFCVPIVIGIVGYGCFIKFSFWEDVTGTNFI